MKKKSAEVSTPTALTKASRPTIGDVAKLAAVSMSTVSRVINEKSHIAPETRERVLDALQKLGYEAGAFQKLDYEPPPARLGSVQALPLFIGITIVTMDSGAYTEILSGVTEELHAHNARPIICPIRHRHNCNMPLLERLIPAVTVGGLILGSPETDVEVREAIQHGLPCVVICPNEITSADIPVVASANWHGGKTATEYLLELGHQRIGVALYHNPVAKNNYMGRERLAGFQSAMLAAGQTIYPELIHESVEVDRTAGYLAGQYFLNLPQPPTGIIASNIEMADGIIQAAHDQGKTVPGEISVIGFDDMNYANHTTPALTTIRQPFMEMGRVGVDMLFRLIAERSLHATRVELTARLVVGASTAPPLAN